MLHYSHRARAELEGLQAWKRKNMEYITPKMLYPQFLFALMHLAVKRKSGFQEVRGGGEDARRWCGGGAQLASDHNQ